jgi:SRSO17 transposase
MRAYLTILSAAELMRAGSLECALATLDSFLAERYREAIEPSLSDEAATARMIADMTGDEEDAQKALDLAIQAEGSLD